VAVRLAGIESQADLSLSEADALLVERAIERGAVLIDRLEELPSAWEVGRGVEASIDAADAAAVKGLGAVTQAATAFVLGIQYVLGGLARKAPGGAEQVPPQAKSGPPPVVERPPWLEKQGQIEAGNAGWCNIFRFPSALPHLPCLLRPPRGPQIG
jgi:hypothetical protein